MPKILDLMKEKENPTSNLYLTPGTRAQMIGAQNGSFPAFGHHLPYEMGGVWTHPIKLLEGFWLGLKINDEPFTWLEEASVFRNYGFYNEHIYELPTLRVIRRQFVPEDTPGVVVLFRFENLTGQEVEIKGEFVARSHIRPVWFSDTVGIEGGYDLGQIDGDRVLIKDSKNPWFAKLQLLPCSILGKEYEENKKETFSFNDMVEAEKANLNDCDNIVEAKKVNTDDCDSKMTISKIELGEEINAYEETYGEGIGVRWWFDLKLTPKSSLPLTTASTCVSSCLAGEKESKSFFLAGNGEERNGLIFKVTGGVASCEETADVMKEMEDISALFAKKEARYQEIIETAEIEIPDKDLMEQYTWVKCHMEWLTTMVPKIGRGLTAGSPEYPWWFGCDNSYALSGCVPAGFHQLAKDTLDTVGCVSMEHNRNGRIVHEINTFGVVCNPGNTQETAHFVCALYLTYKWTGDKRWLRKHYEGIKAGLRWLFEEMDTDGDLFPEGYGIMEVAGLNGELIDTAVYSGKALEFGGEIAEIFGEQELATKYRKLSQKLTNKIITEMWLEEEGLFADIRISGKLLYEKLDDFIWQVNLSGGGEHNHLIHYYKEMKKRLHREGLAEDDEDRPWCFKNWVINTPLEMGLATKEQAERSLGRLNSPEFTGEYGMYLSGLEQTRMMTISAGVMANANLRYGKADQALKQIGGTMKTFGRYLVGSHSEMSPDYGCFVQAWTSYVMLSPIITGFMGINPDAGNKRVEILPNLPSVWEYARIKRLKIGTNVLDVSMERGKVGYNILVSSKEEGWIFETAKENELFSCHNPNEPQTRISNG